eukprot:GHVR01119964.1.p1 GENE.GHVR01119964.1~~GHVR01119964.1.p1  ORF type:complete len:316 (+),score=89.11 GHVR01119964.1:88-1035(+)
MAERGLTAAREVSKQQPENSEFPIVCETCMGSNPYIRMIRGTADRECNICTRPYTSFRWRPGGKDARYKSTVVCQGCARLKNVCQVCIFDMEYGLPVEVRDKYLEESQKVHLPSEGPNRDFYTDSLSKQADSVSYGKAAAHPMLEKLARLGPYYKRNRTKFCTFWIKGECKRGSECPYYHGENDHDPELNDQRIKDRYIGENDPVAARILSKAYKQQQCIPEDKTVTSLFVNNLPNNINENNIRDKFYEFGEIKNIKMSEGGGCVVTYKDRSHAETAADVLMTKGVCVCGVNAKVSWFITKIDTNTHTHTHTCYY